MAKHRSETRSELTEDFTEFSVVDVRVGHCQLLPLVFRPHHERIHGTSDSDTGNLPTPVPLQVQY